MKANDAWRNPDVEATLLQESLNLMMQSLGYGFGIVIEPVTVKKDYWDYNRQLILKDKRRVKKITIYFGNGTLDPRVLEYINQTPILKRLLKEMWEAKRGKLELEDPSGRSIFDKRKRDITQRQNNSRDNVGPELQRFPRVGNTAQPELLREKRACLIYLL